MANSNDKWIGRTLKVIDIPKKKQQVLYLLLIKSLIKIVSNVTRINSNVDYVTQRQKKRHKLYEEQLVGDKSEFSVTLDEALIDEYETNWEVRICYVSRGENIVYD